MFLELEDTYTYNFTSGGNRALELTQVTEALKPVEVRTYTQEEAHMHQQGIQCFSCETISYQLWTVKQCFGMAIQHEETTKLPYTWFVRARPDTKPLRALPFDEVYKQHAAPDEKIAWRQPTGGGSYRLCVMTRAAAASLGRAHDSLFLSREAGLCGFGASSATDRCVWSDGFGFLRQGKIRAMCAPSFAGKYRAGLGMTPECLFYLAWKSDNVTVNFDSRLTALPARPLGVKP